MRLPQLLLNALVSSPLGPVMQSIQLIRFLCNSSGGEKSEIGLADH